MEIYIIKNFTGCTNSTLVMSNFRLKDSKSEASIYNYLGLRKLNPAENA